MSDIVPTGPLRGPLRKHHPSKVTRLERSPSPAGDARSGEERLEVEPVRRIASDEGL